MATRQERGRPSAFIPDERGIGGAYQILSDFNSFQAKKHSDHIPSRAVYESRKIDSMHSAQRMSTNKAVRKAAVDAPGAEHMRNMYHLNRRIENQYTLTLVLIATVSNHLAM
eukprot:gene32150-16681_t